MKNQPSFLLISTILAIVFQFTSCSMSPIGDSPGEVYFKEFLKQEKKEIAEAERKRKLLENKVIKYDEHHIFLTIKYDFKTMFLSLSYEFSEPIHAFKFRFPLKSGRTHWKIETSAMRWDTMDGQDLIYSQDKEKFSSFEIKFRPKFRNQMRGKRLYYKFKNRDLIFHPLMFYGIPMSIKEGLSFKKKLLTRDIEQNPYPLIEFNANKDFYLVRKRKITFDEVKFGLDAKDSYIFISHVRPTKAKKNFIFLGSKTNLWLKEQTSLNFFNGAGLIEKKLGIGQEKLRFYIFERLDDYYAAPNAEISLNEFRIFSMSDQNIWKYETKQLKEHLFSKIYYDLIFNMIKDHFNYDPKTFPWPYLGHFQALASRLLYHTNIIGLQDLKDRFEFSLNACLLGKVFLQDKVRTDTGLSTLYFCGSAMALLVEADIKKMNSDRDLFNFWKSLLAEFKKKNSLSFKIHDLTLNRLAHNQTVTKAIDDIYHFKINDFDDFFTNAFSSLSVRISKQDKGPKSFQLLQLKMALQKILGPLCPGKKVVHIINGRILVIGDKSCKLKDFEIVGMEKIRIEKGLFKFYTSLYQQCEQGQNINFITRQQGIKKVNCQIKIPKEVKWHRIITGKSESQNSY